MAALATDAPLAQGPDGQIDQPARTLAERWPALARWVIFGPDLGTRRRLHGVRIYSVASQPLPEQLLLPRWQERLRHLAGRRRQLPDGLARAP